MKHLRTLVPALLLTPLMLGAGRRADAVAFHPAEGSSLNKSFAMSFDASVGDISIYVDGQDMSGQIPSDAEIAAEFTMAITDEYRKMSDGKPLDLVRAYNSLSGTVEMNGGGESDSNDAEGFDEMEGKSVRFTWNEDSGEYDVAFHESEGDEDMLKPLTPDMDLRGLLPAGDVSVGDTWTVGGTALSSVLTFGNRFDLSEADVEDEAGQMVMEELMPKVLAMGENFVLNCEYKGQRDVDGTSVGVIGLTLSGEGEIDFASLIENVVDMQAGGEIEIDMTVSLATFGVELSGGGECLWNREAGHLSQFDLNGDFVISVGVEIDAEVMGESHSVEADIELTGAVNWSAAAE